MENRELNKYIFPVKNIVITALVMVCIGFVSFLTRRNYSQAILGDFFWDALGAIAWSGLLTSLVSFIYLWFMNKNKYRQEYDKKIKNSRYLLATNRPELKIFLISLAISWVDEFLQATNFSKVIPQNFWTHLIFGSVFSWWDLPFYLIGVLIGLFSIFRTLKYKV